MLTFVGILGYLCYGDSVPDIIIAALPKDASALAVLRVCLIAGIFFTFPMQVFPITEVLDSYLIGVGSGGGHARTRPFASSLTSAGNDGATGTSSSSSATSSASFSTSLSASPILVGSDGHLDNDLRTAAEPEVSSAARVFAARAAVRVATVAAIAGVAIAVPQVLQKCHAMS